MRLILSFTMCAILTVLNAACCILAVSSGWEVFNVISLVATTFVAGLLCADMSKSKR